MEVTEKNTNHEKVADVLLSAPRVAISLSVGQTRTRVRLESPERLSLKVTIRTDFGSISNPCPGLRFVLLLRMLFNRKRAFFEGCHFFFFKSDFISSRETYCACI